jgi:hypothetical protein
VVCLVQLSQRTTSLTALHPLQLARPLPLPLPPTSPPPTPPTPLLLQAVCCRHHRHSSCGDGVLSTAHQMMMLRLEQPLTPGLLLLLLLLRRRRGRVFFLHPAALLLWALLPSCMHLGRQPNYHRCLPPCNMCDSPHRHTSSVDDACVGATFSMRPCLGFGPRLYFALGRKRATCSKARVGEYQICCLQSVAASV